VNDPPVMGILLRMLLAEFDNFALDTLIPNEDGSGSMDIRYVCASTDALHDTRFVPACNALDITRAHDMWAC